MAAQGRKLHKTERRKYEQWVTCLKLSAVVALANFKQKDKFEKGLLISKWNKKQKAKNAC
jgi:hypothetical protein